MAARERLLDEGADVYSLNMCMLEVRAVQQGGRCVVGHTSGRRCGLEAEDSQEEGFASRSL